MALQRLEHQGAAPVTGLAGSISAGAGTLTLVSGTGYPTGAVGPFVLALDPGTSSEEKVLCSSRSGVTVTITTRGYDGTTATTHQAGTSNVAHVWSAVEADDQNAHIYTTTRDDHPQYARTDGTRALTGPLNIGSTSTTVPGVHFTAVPASTSYGTNFGVGTDANSGIVLNTGNTVYTAKNGTANNVLDDGGGNAAFNGTLTIGSSGATGTLRLGGGVGQGSRIRWGGDGSGYALRITSFDNANNEHGGAILYDNGTLFTLTSVGARRNTLDDGSGNATVAGGLTVTGTLTGTSTVQATAHIATLTGTNGRYVGSTNGAPSSGTYLTNDFATDPTNGYVWFCTSGGTPGTWAHIGTKVAGRVYPTAQTAITSGAGPGAVANLTTDFANGVTVNGSGNLVIATTGVYQVNAQVGWQSSGAVPGAGAYSVVLYKNGSQIRASNVYADGSKVYPTPMLSDVLSLTAGDTLALYCQQTSTGLAATDPNATWLSCALVGR